LPFVFEKEGFRFAFYSNDHRPIHVHVRKAGAEAIFDVEDEVELRESQGFKV
jgi:acyl dehydratase